MKMTLLKIVKQTLSSLDSDEVNSISDTIEAQQIADIAEDTYYYLLEENNDWSFLEELGVLESLSDSSRPTFLRLPAGIRKAINIQYDVTLTTDTKRTIKQLTYLDKQDFLDFVYSRDTSESNIVEVTTATGVKLFIRNDIAPTYWTTFDDEIIVFDSYVAAEETTVQGLKSVALLEKIPNWTSIDTFIPDLPDKFFPTYLAAVKNAAFEYLKQQQSLTDSRRAARGLSRLRHFGSQVKPKKEKPTYGRK